jgi:hypothetical protein
MALSILTRSNKMSKNTLDTDKALAAIDELNKMLKSQGTNHYTPHKIEEMVRAIQKVPGIINQPDLDGEYPIILAAKYANGYMIDYIMQKFGATLEGIVDKEGHSPLFHVLNRVNSFLLKSMEGSKLNDTDKEAIKAGPQNVLNYAKSSGLMDSTQTISTSTNNSSNNLSHFYDNLENLGSYVVELMQSNGSYPIPNLGIELSYKPDLDSIHYKITDKEIFNDEVLQQLQSITDNFGMILEESKIDDTLLLNRISGVEAYEGNVVISCAQINEYIMLDNPETLYDAMDRIKDGVAFADLNNPEKGQELPLITALKNNKIYQLVKDLIEIGRADVNKTDGDGHSPLYHLLANYNYKDNPVESSDYYVRKSIRTKLIEYLIEKGAKLTDTDIVDIGMEDDPDIADEILSILEKIEKAENALALKATNDEPNSVPIAPLPSTIEQILEPVIKTALASGKAIVPNAMLILSAPNESDDSTTLVIKSSTQDYICDNQAQIVNKIEEMIAKLPAAVVLKNQTVPKSIIEGAKAAVDKSLKEEQIVFIDQTDFMVIPELMINTKGEGDFQIHLCDYSAGNTKASALRTAIVTNIADKASRLKLKLCQTKFEEKASVILEQLASLKAEEALPIEPTTLILQKDANGKLKCLNVMSSDENMKIFTLLSRSAESKGLKLEAVFDNEKTQPPALERIKLDMAPAKHADKIDSKKITASDPVINELLNKVIKSKEAVPFESTNLALKLENGSIICGNTLAGEAFSSAKRAIEDLCGTFEFKRSTYDKTLPKLIVDFKGTSFEDEITKVLYEGSSIILKGANLLLVPADDQTVHCYDITKMDPNYLRLVKEAQRMNLTLEPYIPPKQQTPVSYSCDDYGLLEGRDTALADAELMGATTKGEMDEVD